MISTAELLANGTTTASILLAGRNSIHTWWTGIAGCLLFAYVFYESLLYADVLLQGFFVVTSLIGWWQWQHGNRGQALHISGAGINTLGIAIVCGLAATVAYGAMLHYFTNAYAPFADSAVLAFSVIAQIFLMQRRIGTWLFWLIVNSIAVPLYASRELNLTALLYAAYWINAGISWQRWRKLAADGV